MTTYKRSATPNYRVERLGRAVKFLQYAMPKHYLC